MSIQKDQLKILLLQIRNDKETMIEEFYEFVQFSGLQEDQFTSLNTFVMTDFDTSVIEQYNALFIGGSSDASVLKPSEFLFISNCRLLIRHCYHHNIPVFASCFGFQMMVQEFGGEIILDSEHMEMGTYRIELNEAAKTDPLLYDMTSPFWAVSGHKERATLIPKNAIKLGSTPLCPYHIIKINNKPMYGFQFHPEIDTKDLIVRLRRYQNLYVADTEQLEEIIASIYPDTSCSNKLVSKFIDRVILGINAQDLLD